MTATRIRTARRLDCLAFPFVLIVLAAACGWPGALAQTVVPGVAAPSSPLREASRRRTSASDTSPPSTDCHRTMSWPFFRIIGGSCGLPRGKA